ncbi:MAG: SDR family NAD(P)-dependent oxidoreductase [Rudaea sp.]
MGLLDNRVAVITGGTRGFGLAVARAYAREGAAVVVTSRSEESVRQAVEMLRAQNGRASGIACDVSDLQQVRALSGHAHATFGPIDIWLNNAGLAGVYGPTMHVAPASFVSVTETNILGTYYGSLVAMQEFLARGRGKLINVTGRGAEGPVPLQNAYASSKAWIKSFTLALAREYKESGIGVFLLAPGMMTTEMLTQVEVVEGYEARLRVMPTILRMWASSPEVPAERAVWLASPSTDGKTGIQAKEMTPLRMIGGMVGEGLRRLRGRGDAPIQVGIKPVPPAIQNRQSSQAKGK